MLTKPSNLKLAVAILVFVALYLSYNIPGAFGQKIVQIASLVSSLFLMFVIMRNPEERGKKWLNIILSVLILATLLTYALK
jgi:cell division protein FtsW (lipid II flippase)